MKEVSQGSFLQTLEFQVIVFLLAGGSLSFLLWPLGVLAFIVGGLYLFSRVYGWVGRTVTRMVGEEMTDFLFRLLASAVIVTIGIALTACGSDNQETTSAPVPSVRVAYADLTSEAPSASIGFEGCRLDTNKAEVDARTDAEVTLGNTVLSYRYDTQDGAFYLSEDGSRSMQIFDRQGFVRVSISCEVK